MNLKDCKYLTIPMITVAALLESDLNVNPPELPQGARVMGVAQLGDDIQVFYTIAPQGLPQEDIDKLVRLVGRKGLWLTDKEALKGLEEHAVHQYGVGRLSSLTPEQYEEMVKHFRFLEVVPPASAL